MGTKVYGTSDDLIEVEGGKCAGEVGCYGTDRRDKGVLLIFDDATVLEVKYCKKTLSVWGVEALRQGPQFDRIDVCTDEDADPYSDVAHFKADMKWCYAATGDWELVQ